MLNKGLKMINKDRKLDKKSVLPDEYIWHRNFKTDYSIIEGKRILTNGAVLSGELKPEKFIVNSKNSSKVELEEYCPLIENRFLHRDFALIKHEVNSVLEFSKVYGLLGIDEWFQDVSVSNNHQSYGERLSTWFEAASEIRKTIDLWDKSQKEDEKGLAERLQWHEKNDEFVLMNIYQRPEAIGPDSKIVIHSDKDAVLAKKVKQISISEQAQFVVGEEINKHLYKHTSAMIHQDLTNQKTPSIKMTPKNLLGWLWVQLANEVTRDSVYLECLNCGKRMLKKVTRGQPSKSCSASCRVQLSQRKTKLQ